jgi:serine protease Do
LGEGNTATAGIISAKDKIINVDGTKLNVIQTDAAINPGNSGGPLINMRGEVIGINTAKFSESTVEGMGYSITSGVAKPIIEKLTNQETRPYLGIEASDVTKKIADLYNLPAMGVYVGTVMVGSSAEKAGIQPSDIITSFNEESILNFKDLTAALQKCKIGESVKVKVLRQGKDTITLNVVLTSLPDTNF